MSGETTRMAFDSLSFHWNQVRNITPASSSEAALAISCGASAVGLVSSMPSGLGVICEALIANIAAKVPPPIATFLLTSQRSAAAIAAQQRRYRTNTIQLCDHLPRPFGLDVCNGVRINDALDPAKLDAFFAVVEE